MKKIIKKIVKLFNKDNIIYTLLITMFFSIFLFNDTFREIIYSAFNINLKIIGLNGNYNFLFIITFVTFIYKYLIKYNSLKLKDKFDYFILSLILVILILFIVQNIVISSPFGYILVYLLWFISAFIIISIKLEDSIIKKLFFNFVKYYNYLILLLLIFGIIDTIFKGNLQILLAKNFIKSGIKDVMINEHKVNIYRLHSFLGHALTTTLYFIVFFVLNNIKSWYFKESINSYIINIVTFIGVILSGSKIGFVLALILILFMPDIKVNNKLLYYSTILFSGLLSLFLPFVKNNLVRRFKIALSRGDITNGRFKALNRLFTIDVEKPKVLIGYGYNYSRIITDKLRTSNFEMPIIMLAYDYGIIATILIYIILYIYPAYIFIKNKTYYIFAGYTFIFLFLNTYNALAVASDNILVLAFIIMILNNLSNYINKHRSNGKVDEY